MPSTGCGSAARDSRLSSSPPCDRVCFLEPESLSRSSARLTERWRGCFKTKEQVKRGIALLTFKEVNGTLTPRERQLLVGLRKELAAINAKLSAPKRPRATSKSPNTVRDQRAESREWSLEALPGHGKRS